MLSHEPRHLPPCLIFDVRQKKEKEPLHLARASFHLFSDAATSRYYLDMAKFVAFAFGSQTSHRHGYRIRIMGGMDIFDLQ